jgi:hypothetical protein
VSDKAGLLVRKGRDVHHITGRRHGDRRSAETVVLDERRCCELLGAVTGHEEGLVEQ